jgi:hypothetical protein
MGWSDEEMAVLVEIRDLLVEANAEREERDPDALTQKLRRAEAAIHMLEKGIGNVEDALVDIALAFDELARSAGVSNRIATRTRFALASRARMLARRR